LTGKNTLFDIAMEFSRCTGLAPTFWKAAKSAVSQNSTAWRLIEVDVILGWAESSDGIDQKIDDINELGASGVKSSGFPRKEVIQPQLPLRLPCYDFVPITSPTFDGSLPCGLGHRLRVLPAFMTWRAVCTRPGNVFTAALLIRDY
jgi:hypothetical protein